jgi:hypothetical protein
MRFLAFRHKVHNNSPKGIQQNLASEVENAVTTNTYMVRLHDLNTDREQTILVRSANADGMQEFVDSIKDHPEWPQLTLTTPRVVPGGIRRLEIRRPLPRTTLTSFVA